MRGSSGSRGDWASASPRGCSGGPGRPISAAMAATAAARTQAILKLKIAGRTRLIVFDTQDLTLGRATENDISVDDPEMSRRHAVFKRSREGCAVQDLGTSNGTAV